MSVSRAGASRAGAGGNSGHFRPRVCLLKISFSFFLFFVFLTLSWFCDFVLVRNFDSLVVFRPNGGLYGKMRGFSYFRGVESKYGDLMRFRWK